MSASSRRRFGRALAFAKLVAVQSIAACALAFMRPAARPIAAASWLPSTTTAPVAAPLDQVEHGHGSAP
jgi:hypothetical protein